MDSMPRMVFISSSFPAAPREPFVCNQKAREVNNQW
jgi:hypothetical protein